MYTQEIADAICARLAEGESLRSICRDSDMPSEAEVYRWLADDANAMFRESYARAREAHADAEFDGMAGMADEAPERDDEGRIDPAWVARQRLRIDTRKWTLARMSPKKYGEKVQNELSGPDGGPVQVTGISVTLVKPSEA